jgi:hypothetical protein
MPSKKSTSKRSTSKISNQNKAFLTQRDSFLRYIRNIGLAAAIPILLSVAYNKYQNRNKYNIKDIKAYQDLSEPEKTKMFEAITKKMNNT